MNYITEINGFERWLETHQLPTMAQLLWYKIAYLSSRAGWPEWTQVDNRRLMVSLQIAREATLTESRERLVNAGLIEYQKGKKGFPGRYRIVSFEEKATKYTYNLKSQNVVQGVGNLVVQTVDIIKEKEKTNSLSSQTVERRDKGDSLPRSRNRFQNFEQRNTNYDDLVLKRIRERLAADTSHDRDSTLSVNNPIH